MQKTDANENSLSSVLYRGFVGLLFGFANVIPGVSGGTVMVVLGVYERIISIITDFRHRIKSDWKFFLPIVAGMAVAIVLFGRLMSGLLENHKAVTQMFFIGVIVFSVPAIFKSAAFDSRKKLNIKPACVLAFVLVLGLMTYMSLSKANDELKTLKSKDAAETIAESEVKNGIVLIDRNSKTEKVAARVTVLAEKEEKQDVYAPDHSALHLTLLIVYGAVAAATMIIPGISGSLVMVMLGQYENVMHAIKHFDVVTLLPFGIGCVLGIVFCAKLIRWLLDRHSQLTYSAILGFVLGSILSVFPGWGAVASIAGIIAFLIGGGCIVGCNWLSKRFG